MDQVIKVAAVQDNRILADSLRTWFSEIADIDLMAVTSTVSELLRHEDLPADVVLLNAELPDRARSRGQCPQTARSRMPGPGDRRFS